MARTSFLSRLTTFLLVAAAAFTLAVSRQDGSVVLAGVLEQIPTSTDALTHVINYQGRLVDPTTGAPKADGSYSMTFRIYDDAAAGATLWTEIKDITVSKGLFSTLLGDTTALPATVFDGNDRWLGVKVGADAETTPRMRLAFVPYATWAINAAALGGQAGAFYRNASNINAGTVPDVRIDAGITRDTEVLGLITAADGLGSGLDADLLDGQSSDAFAATIHSHDDRYFTEGESDGRYVNTSGDLMSGSRSTPILSVTQSGVGSAIQGSTDSTANHIAGVYGTAGTTGLTLSKHSGLLGESKTGIGVAGVSADHYAVYGHSINSIGVFAYSQNSDALYAAGTIKADKVVYITPRTHYYSISGDTFKPRYITPGTYLLSGGGTAGTYFHTSSTGGGGDQLFAPVHLPDGATITGITVYYNDATAATDLSATFFRHSITGGYTSITAFSSSGSAGPGSASASLSTVVNNSNTFYEVYIRPSSGNWSAVGSSLMLIGVTFSYTLSEAP
jgi:hypothetical protein